MPGAGAGLARFLQDWSALWREELRAQAEDPDPRLAGLTGGVPGADLAAAMEAWRSAMVVWAQASGVSPSLVAAPLEAALANRVHPSRAETAAAAPDPRDVEIERLTRRVDELEARLAWLEAPRRARASPKAGNRG
jgi:hypothetical protein